MCLDTIEKEMKKGVSALVKTYSNYISQDSVKSVSAPEIKSALTAGKVVWCKEGFISIKCNTLSLNNNLLMPSDIRRLAQDKIIVL